MRSWTPEEAIKHILLGCKAMGWTVLIPNVDEHEDVPGLVMGTKEFCAENWETGEVLQWDPSDTEKAQ